MVDQLCRRLGRWYDQLIALREVKTESLEAGIWLSSLLLFCLIAYRVPWAVLSYLTAFLPRLDWLLMTGALFLLSFFGYLDERLWMRRMGGFLSMVFWLWTGGLLFRGYPYAAALHLGLAGLWSWVWTRVGHQADTDRIKTLDAKTVHEEITKGNAPGLAATIFRH